LYREETGTGLAEAKDAVERIERGDATGEITSGADDFETQILDLMVEGQKIAAIKLYRERIPSGLKEAKDAVEELAARHGITTPTKAGCLGVLVLLAGLPVLSTVCFWDLVPRDNRAESIGDNPGDGVIHDPSRALCIVSSDFGPAAPSAMRWDWNVVGRRSP
jgi:hypothetical protein